MTVGVLWNQDARANRNFTGVNRLMARGLPVEVSMQGDGEVSLLMFGTIGAVLLVAIILMLKFLRKPKNQHPMDGQRERNIDEIRHDAGDPQ